MANAAEHREEIVDRDRSAVAARRTRPARRSQPPAHATPHRPRRRNKRARRLPSFRPGCTSASHSIGESEICFVSNTSTLPRRKSFVAGFCCDTRCAREPLRCPYNRAGKTLVLLKTTRSSGRNRSGNSRNRRSSTTSRPRSTCSRREAARSAGGCWAINSSGRW